MHCAAVEMSGGNMFDICRSELNRAFILLTSDDVCDIAEGRGMLTILCAFLLHNGVRRELTPVQKKHLAASLRKGADDISGKASVDYLVDIPIAALRCR